MNNAIIRNIGVFAIAVGVIFLALSYILEKASNDFLFISAALIIGGLSFYAFINKKIM